MPKYRMANLARVCDVMSEAVVFLDAGMDVYEAAEYLTRHRINGAPVLGVHGRVVGIVSKTDLVDPRRQSNPGGRVEDVMTRVVYAVRAHDPVMLAVRLMVGENIHRAVVVNEDGSLAGIVAPMDVMRGLANGLRVMEDEAASNFVDLRKVWRKKE